MKISAGCPNRCDGMVFSRDNIYFTCNKCGEIFRPAEFEFDPVKYVEMDEGMVKTILKSILTLSNPTYEQDEIDFDEAVDLLAQSKSKWLKEKK